MKVFLTGASGFLGKEVLKQLLERDEVEEIHIVSRSRLSHPSERVIPHRADLSEKKDIEKIKLENIDAVIHLAGLYDFRKSFTDNYTNNVLSTLNIIQKIENEGRKIPLYYASTYAADEISSSREVGELPLETIPAKASPYARCKAFAEKVVTDSEIPGGIFRLGVVVGDTKHGKIQKIDGPYHVLKLVSTLAKSKAIQKAKIFPIIANPRGILPMVPVDFAAKAFVSAIFKPELREGPAKIYGVYSPSSERMDDLADSILNQYLPEARPVFVQKDLARLTGKLTKIPSAVFEFALKDKKFTNENYRKTFPEAQIPEFSTYESVFYEGFKDYMEARV